MTENQAAAQKKRNEKFAKLKPAQQRVAIAKDVIAALAAKKLKATPGTYLSVEKFTGKDIPKGKDELQSVLQKVETCNVCALGAAFVCTVALADNLKVRGLLEGHSRYWDDEKDEDVKGKVAYLSVRSSDMHDYLGKFFDFNQLWLIENAFENADLHDKYKFGEATVDENGDETSFSKSFDKASAFASKSSPTKRMIKIMENIIKNEGTFKP